MDGCTQPFCLTCIDCPNLATFAAYIPLPGPESDMHPSSRPLRIATAPPLLALLVSSFIGLAGCSSGLVATPAIEMVSVAGNWQFSSTAPAAARLGTLSGALTGQAAAITAILHSDSPSSCISPNTPVQVHGATSAMGVTTLTGELGGGTLTITGNLAPDGKSFTEASFNVAGGSCAFQGSAPVSAQSFSPITGSYSGTFSDVDGPVITITSSLTQTPQADTDGNFQLTGSASFGANPCFVSPVNVSSTQVTGGRFTFTYADAVTLNSVTANGTFTPDGATLNVTSWTLTGPCGGDSGVGTLTRQN